MRNNNDKSNLDHSFSSSLSFSIWSPSFSSTSSICSYFNSLISWTKEVIEAISLISTLLSFFQPKHLNMIPMAMLERYRTTVTYFAASATCSTAFVKQETDVKIKKLLDAIFFPLSGVCKKASHRVNFEKFLASN